MVEIGDEFQPEYENLPDEVQDELDSPSSTIRAAIKAATRRYDEWFPTCEYEGIAF